MIGYHAVPVIADAYLKGIRGFDTEEALEAMKASATYAPYGGLGDYMKLGYVPIDHEPEAASKTLEYAYDDWTIARMAKAMGTARRSDLREARGELRCNIFDPVDRLHARLKKSDGQFREPFDPLYAAYGGDYTEGNAWQYTLVRAARRGGADHPDGRATSGSSAARRAVQLQTIDPKVQARGGHRRV